MNQKIQTTQIFSGERYDNCQLDEDALSELIIYQKLLRETAKILWKQKNSDRARLPAEFEKKCQPRVVGLHQGSACVDIEIFEYGTGNECEEAIELVADTIEAINENTELPKNFPKQLLPILRQYGKTIKANEFIGQITPKRSATVKYTAESRKKFLEKFKDEPRNIVEIQAEVTMVNVANQKLQLKLDDGRSVSASFKTEQEKLVTEALMQHKTIRLEISGEATFTLEGELDTIIDIHSLNITPLQADDSSISKPPIWVSFQEILNDIPNEILDKLPSDSASELDHYLYGKPKKKNAS